MIALLREAHARGELSYSQLALVLITAAVAVAAVVVIILAVVS